MSKQTEALKLAQEAIDDRASLTRWKKARDAIREALAEQPAQQEPVPVTDNTYNYAKSLAEAIFKQHFASDEHYASGRIVWGVNDTVIGILTQIDNMVADMVRRPAQQQEPVAWKDEQGNVRMTLDAGEIQSSVGYVYSVHGERIKNACIRSDIPNGTPLYTSTPASKPLSVEQIAELDCNDHYKFARAIEAAHGIKEKNT